MDVLNSASKLGLLLAILLMAAGSVLIAFPQKMTVHHQVNQRGTLFGSRSGVEKVDHPRSRLYGGSLLLFGLTIAAFSVYKPRT